MSPRKHAIAALALATAAAAAMSLNTAHAELALGGSVGSTRANDGDFEGSGNAGWKLTAGGYSHILGGEINYVDFGDLGGSGGPHARAWAPAVTAGVQLGKTDLYGKFGLAFAEVDGSSVREEYSNNDPFYGVGARFGATQGLGVRVEYERYKLEHEDLDQASLGLEFRFQ